MLSERITAALGEAVRRGVKVSLATGRMPSSAVVFANRLGLVEPVIGHQGAIVRAMPSGRPRAGPRRVCRSGAAWAASSPTSPSRRM